jgi:phospholipase/carboxylesterase
MDSNRTSGILTKLGTELVPVVGTVPAGLVIVLHGLGDTHHGWRWFPDELGLRQVAYLLVDAPDDYYAGFAWYDFYGDQGAGIRRSRLLLHQLLDECRERGFASERTVMVGFSQGCVMALEAGLRYPHRLAGLVGISGYVYEQERLVNDLGPSAHEVPVLLTHGTRDPLLNVGVTRAQASRLKEAGLKVHWHEYLKEHTVEMTREIPVIREFIQGCLALEQPSARAL